MKFSQTNILNLKTHVILISLCVFSTALDKGKHVFELFWPMGHRSQFATVGVGSSEAKMFIKPRESLIGCDRFSWGLDIARRKLIHRGEITGSMPRNIVPEK